MKKLNVLLGTLAAIVALVVPAAAGAAPPTPGGKPSKADQLWLTKALQIDLFEVRSGKVAGTNAVSPAVKKLGETLARAHSQAAARDKPRARKFGATVPTRPSAAMQAELKMLAGKKGSAFDKAFVRAEIKGHEKAIEGAEAEIANGKNQGVVAVAKLNLKMYVMHLRMAQALR